MNKINHCSEIMEVCNAMVDCCSEKKVLIEYETIFFGDLVCLLVFFLWYIITKGVLI